MVKYRPDMKKVGGVIQQIHEAYFKKRQLMQMMKASGVNPMLAIGATAGLGLWLASSALNSKRHAQGEY